MSRNYGPFHVFDAEDGVYIEGPGGHDGTWVRMAPEDFYAMCSEWAEPERHERATEEGT